MIRVKNIYKSFDRNEVLKGLNIDFKPQSVTAVLGPNSSGKTTLMKALLGMVLPDKGEIWIDKLDVRKESDYRKLIGYLPQIARFPENITVRELFEMISKLRNAPANSETLVDYFDLKPFLNKRLGHLSGGTRQKVNIVQAFMFDTPYLFLDEPTAGLDPLSLIKLKDLINAEKKKGKTILITSHIMSFVEEMADEVIYILDGQINFNGHPRQIISEYLANSLEEAIAKVLHGLPDIGQKNGQQNTRSTIIRSFKKENIDD